MSRDPCVYMMANQRNERRTHQHRSGSIPGFTNRYGCKLLVWYERFPTMPEAIAGEKNGSRVKKLTLFEAMNPGWADLYPTLSL